MSRIETKQIPKELHPTGERLLKIMYDDKEPPKDYIWGKDDDYFIWNGKKWIPYEFEIIKNKGCYQKNCGCVSKEEMAVKFDKLKKDILAAVLKMNQAQGSTNIADIRAELEELKVVIHQLEEFENYYTKTEIDNNYYTKEAVDNKTTELTNLTNLLNGSVGSLSRRVTGIETNFSDFAAAITTALSNKADKSEIPEAYDDVELINRIEAIENNPATNPTIVTRIESLEK